MGRRHNQHDEPLDQTGPATRYGNQRGAYADDRDRDNSGGRHCLDATHNWAQGAATYGTRRANKSHR